MTELLSQVEPETKTEIMILSETPALTALSQLGVSIYFHLWGEREKQTVRLAAPNGCYAVPARLSSVFLTTTDTHLKGFCPVTRVYILLPKNQ